MSVETDADRLAMIADFGVTISWTVGAATTTGIVALFDGGTIPQLTQDGVDTLNTRATLTLREADLPAGAGAADDTVVVAGVSYHPKAVMPDGQGMAVVTLEAA